MERFFEHELGELRKKLLAMGIHAIQAVRDSVDALDRRNTDLALRVKANDVVLDRFELEVDEMAIHLLAKAPLASDLRLVTMAMKLSQEFERVGDEATKIAKRAVDLNQDAPLALHLDVREMSAQVLGMLDAALDALIRRDSVAARAIIPRDRSVNALHKKIREEIIVHMQKSPENILRCLHWMVAAKSLERIGDHATNIAEEVVYLCEAQDIRHLERVN